MSSVDALQNRVETKNRIFNRPFGGTAISSNLVPQDCLTLNMHLRSNSAVENNLEQRSRTPIVGSMSFRSQSRFNQNLAVNDPVNKSSALRTFGLQSRISSTNTPLNFEESLRLNHGTHNLHHRSNMSSVSKTFGLVSEDITSLSVQNNERLNQEFRKENNINLSVMPRSLGLLTRNISSSHLLSEEDIAEKQDLMNIRRNNINASAMSGTSGLNSENLGSLYFHDNGNFNQSSRRNLSHAVQIPSKNLTNVCNEGNLRLNQYSNPRNNMSFNSKIFGPAVRNSALTTGFQVHNITKSNDDIIDNGGFRRPFLPRTIRGRNSILSSRLFHNQSTRHCQDLGNINGFNVSHISQRDVDTLSESRSALNMRSNCIDNQSIGESVLSVTSVKSQFLNLLENLHHSILNIGPQVTAEAVRMEFDRAKQRLDNISEISFAPSVNELGPISVINQSSKHIGPSVTESESNAINEGPLHLKSSQDLLKMIKQGRKNFEGKFSESTSTEKKEKTLFITSSQNKEFIEEQDSDSLFKKPKAKPNIKRKNISQMMNIKMVIFNAVRASFNYVVFTSEECVALTMSAEANRAFFKPEMIKSVTSKTTHKVISLREWYPIANGSSLILCGINEQGETVKTNAIKKRLNSRKVELVNGLGCNLIGSPSGMVSFLPKNIINLLKNGLTERWRVLQRELLNCQTIDEINKSRKSRSPSVKCSPKKKIEKAHKGKVKKGKLESPKVVSSPKKRNKEFHTRSGRTVKPPGMFWLLPGNGEVTSSLELCTFGPTSIGILSKKRTPKRAEETPLKKSKKPTTPIKKQKNGNVVTPKKKQENAKGNTPKKIEKNTNKNTPKKKLNNVNESTPKKIQNKANENTPKKKPNSENENTSKKKLKSEKKKTLNKKQKNTKNVRKSDHSPVGKHKRRSAEFPSRNSKSPGSASPQVKKTGNESSKKLKQTQLQLISPKKCTKKEDEEVKVHSSTEDEKQRIKTRQAQGNRKRKVTADSDCNQAKKSKLEKKTEVEVESTVYTPEPTKKGKTRTNKFALTTRSPKPKEIKSSPVNKKRKIMGKKKTAVSKKVTENKKEMKEVTEFEDDFELKLNDIEIPEIANVSGNPRLNRSQLRLMSMETPPLKYFNNNLKLLGSATPIRSPDWCISQRTESEVKQFQKRREEAFKKKLLINIEKTEVTEKSKKIVQSRDLKRMMEWVTEKTVRSPQWSSKLLQYVIPSRRQMEQQDDEEEDEDVETGLL